MCKRSAAQLILAHRTSLAARVSNRLLCLKSFTPSLQVQSAVDNLCQNSHCECIARKMLIDSTDG